MKGKIIIYYHSWMRVKDYFGAVIEKETPKKYIIRPFKSGHFAGTDNSIYKDSVVFSTDEGMKAITKLKALRKANENMESGIRLLKDEYKKISEIILNGD